MTNHVTNTARPLEPWRRRFAGPIVTMVVVLGGASGVDAQPSTPVHEPPRRALADAIRVEAARLLDPSLPPSQPPKRRDSVLNGVLIGAGVGALLGLIPDYYDDCEECHDPLYGSIAMGAGVGLLIDLLHDGRQKSSPSKRSDVRLGVQVSGHRVRIGGRVAWR